MTTDLLEIQTKYVHDLMVFYDCDYQYLDNEQIRNFLLCNRIFPGSYTWKLYRNYFISFGSNREALFEWFEYVFSGFLRTVYRFYSSVSTFPDNASKKIRMIRILCDFYCWSLMNNIQNWFSLNSDLVSDYVTSTDFYRIHSIEETGLLIEALSLYYTMLCNTSESTLEGIENIISQMDLEFREKTVLRASNDIMNPVFKQILKLAMHSGFTFQEILNIKTDDVNFSRQTISYSGRKSGRRLIRMFDQDMKNILIGMVTQAVKSPYLVSVDQNTRSEKRNDYFRNLLRHELENARWKKGEIDEFINRCL